MNASAAMSADAGYVPRLASWSRSLTLRGVPYHVREWGVRGAPLLVLLHGARDTSASFQFMVDALQGEWHVMAPDWRGHGRSGWTPGSYWQAELIADLDALLDDIAPGRAVPLVGHSMGGNIASLYAGVRPARVEQLVMLDALGDLLNRVPVKVDEILHLVLEARNAGAGERSYPRTSDMADRLMRGNRRLGASKAAFLAAATARTMQDGRFGWPHDPSFKRSLPTMHTEGDWCAIWRGITASVLGIKSSDFRPNAPTSDPAVTASRQSCFRDFATITIPDTGHNLHHDAPGPVARAVEAFLKPVRPTGVP